MKSQRYLKICGNNAIIQDLIVSGKIITSGRYAGGVLATQGAGMVFNCTNNVEIIQNYSQTSACSIGGVVGYASGNVKKCVNKASITSISSNARNSVGGIVGVFSSTNECKIEQCYNLDNITATGNSTYCDVGGICGQNYLNISTSYNSGNIYGNGSGQAIVGGIAGVCSGANGIISNCYNSGEIKTDRTIATNRRNWRRFL